MRRFSIVSVDKSGLSVETPAIDEGGILSTMAGLECAEADVYEHKRYSFSVRRDANAVWSIFHRNGDARVFA